MLFTHFQTRFQKFKHPSWGFVSKIVDNPISQRWQTWVSLYGTDITCLTAHNKREDADNVARQIVEAWESGLEDTEQVSAFLRSLPTDGLVDPLPQDVVVRLSKKIRRK